MSDVLACLAASGGALDGTARRVLAFSRRVVARRGGRVAAVVVGPDVEAAAREAVALGAQTAYAVESEGADGPGALELAAASARAVERSGAPIVCVDSGVDGAEVAGRLGVRLDGVAIVRVEAFREEEGALLWERPVHGGKGRGLFEALARPVVVGVGVDAAENGDGGQSGAEGEIVTLAPEGAGRGGVELLERSSAEGARLAEARVVVSGGRGMGGPEGFEVLEKLAALLDGAVGASRAACDAGWVPSTRQVGQTGASVTPDLYLAVGISGAGQHLAGITRARCVVAVNPDPEAPIFERADYGIVKKWQAVLPALIEALQGRTGGAP